MDPQRSYPKRMRACIDVRCMYEPMITMFPCRWPYFLKRQVSHVACILMFLILFIFLSRTGGFFLLLSHPHMQTLSKLTCVPPLFLSRVCLILSRSFIFIFDHVDFLQPISCMYMKNVGKGVVKEKF